MFISASQGLEIMFFLFFHFFHFDHHFFGLKIIISFLSPLSFFIIFSFLFFLPLAFSFFFPLLRKWSLVLGNCHQRLFLEPFSSVFSIAFALQLFFFPMPLKLTWGIAKRSFFSNPFRFFLMLAIFPFCAFKTDLGNCQKELFLEPFSFFFRFGNFSFLCL